jgi:hypothetical protein
MLQHLCMAAAAKLAAALVAVTLSGVPGVVAMHAPAEGHRCTCKAHGGGRHECECANCHKAALAEQASDRNMPPCHRAAARKALSQRESSGSRDVPCVEATCCAGKRPVMTIGGIDPFCIPARTLVAIAGGPEASEPVPRRFEGRSLEPETPPPKAA